MPLFWVGIVFISVNAFAGTARVLLDTLPAGASLQGAFKVSCLKLTSTKNLTPISCRNNGQPGENQNKHSQVEFKRSRFQIFDNSQGIQLQISNGKTLYRFYGDAFRFEGDFLWQGRNLKKIDWVRAPKGREWVVHIPLQVYLQGVLGAEVPGSWPLDTLKAQAIASRSYFLWRQDLKHRYFDVRSDHWDQVFDFEKRPAKKIVQAIRDTKGMYLKSRLTQSVFPAFFHADCGGDTSTEHAVWRRPASENQPIVDRFCQTAKRNMWTTVVSGSKILKKLGEVLLLPRNVVLNAVIPRGRKGQRAHQVDFLMNGNLVKSMSANEFRKIMGFGKIKSTRFVVKKVAYQFEFKGQGYGHGVGMCQWGAKRWAVAGKDYRQILEHYYPTAQLYKKRKKTFPSVAEH